jgi:C4-type Zn-finger protein
MSNCRYCHVAMKNEGFMEQIDDLGVYVAETYQCPQCGYKLEKNPVYIAGAEAEAPLTYIIIEGD